MVFDEGASDLERFLVSACAFESVVGPADKLAVVLGVAAHGVYSVNGGRARVDVARTSRFVS